MIHKKRNNKSVTIYFLILIYSFIFYSCNEESKIKKGEILNKNSKLLIGEKSKYLQYSFNKDHYVIDFHNDEQLKYSDKNWISTCEYDKDGILNVKKSVNFFGEPEHYLFDINNSLYLIKRYIKNKDHNNDYCIQDVISFNNGIIDEKNSNYVDARIIDSLDNKILLEIRYVSGNDFYSGEIFTGDKKIESIKEATHESGIKMTSKVQQFWIPKNQIIFNDYYMEFSMLIKRSSVSKVYWLKSLKTDKKGTTSQFFIVRRLLKSPMIEG